MAKRENYWYRKLNYHILHIKQIKMGLVAIEGMEFYAYHGYYSEEAKLGGQYRVDVYVDADLEEASLNDELTQTINYEMIYEISKREMEHRSKLIEHVCRRILDEVGDSLAMAKLNWIKVRVSKRQPPISGQVDRVYVELEKIY